MNNPSSSTRNPDEPARRRSADGAHSGNASSHGRHSASNHLDANHSNANHSNANHSNPESVGIKAAESFLAGFLNTLQSNSKSKAAILWLRHKKGVRWASSLGVKMSDADRESPYTNDVVSNAEIVFEHEETDIFSCDAEADLPGTVRDPIVKDLVLGCKQLLLPVRLQGETFAVIALFQPFDLPSSEQWSLDDLGLIQKRLNAQVSSHAALNKVTPRQPVGRTQHQSSAQSKKTDTSSSISNTGDTTSSAKSQTANIETQPPVTDSSSATTSAIPSAADAALANLSAPSAEATSNESPRTGATSVDDSESGAASSTSEPKEHQDQCSRQDLNSTEETPATQTSSDRHASPDASKQKSSSSATHSLANKARQEEAENASFLDKSQSTDQTLASSKDPTQIETRRIGSRTAKARRAETQTDGARHSGHWNSDSNSDSPTRQGLKSADSPEESPIAQNAAVSRPNVQAMKLARALKLSNVVGHQLDEEECAYSVANELFGFVGEGRVSVAVFRGSRCRIRAISNQQVFDRRSAVVSCLERLSTMVCQTRRNFFHPDQRNQLSAKMRREVDRYYEVADTQSIAVLPLVRASSLESDPLDFAEIVRDRSSTTGEVIGAVMIEGLVRPLSRADLLADWKLIETPVTNAFGNAREHNSLFLMPVWRGLGRFANVFRGHSRNKALAAMIALIAISTALTLIPGDLKLACEGVIQPTRQSKVFAETSGVVRELLVQDGDWVEQGDTLIQLDDPALLADLASVEGEMLDAKERLRTLKLQRMRDEFDSPDEKREAVLTSSGFEAKLAKLQDQFDLLTQKRNQLTVKSPVAGRVVTWDTRRRLLSRPVESGQSLLTIADSQGPWELELRLPDKRSGYLRNALNENEDAEPPTTSYVLASDPTHVAYGKLREVSRSTEVDEELGNVVRLYVDLNEAPGEDKNVRPGTEVLAQIHVGKASIGYCKLYEFFDWLNRTWFTWS